MLTRRAQLGLRTGKKAANAAAKAKGKAAEPKAKPKLTRKKSARRVLKRAGKKAKSFRSSGSKGLEGEEEMNDGDWVWDADANDYVLREWWADEAPGDSSVGKAENEKAKPTRSRKRKSKPTVTEPNDEDAGEPIGETAGSGKTSRRKPKQPKQPCAKPTAKAKAKAKATAKAKAKAKATAKAKVKPGPKAKASAKKAAAKEKPKAKKGRGKKRCDDQEKPIPEPDDVQWMMDWVSEVEVEGDDDAFKSSVKELICPSAHGYRCNIYWTTGKCGVTLRYTLDGKVKQTDVVTYGFGKSRVAQACGICAASASAFRQHYMW